MKDEGEDEITARIDALLSGGGGASPRSATPAKTPVASAVEQDPFARMRAEIDAELGSISTPLAFEKTPTLEPIVEPLVSDQMETPSVLEALPAPAPSATPVVRSGANEQPRQVVNVETKRHSESKKPERQGPKSASRVDKVAEIAPTPTAVGSLKAAIPVDAVTPIAAKPPVRAPEMTLPRGTIVESELGANAGRRGIPVWAWSAVAVVAVVGLYFLFPHGNSSPSNPKTSPAPQTNAVASAPPVATPPPVASPPSAVSAPSAAVPRVPEPSRAVPDNPKPVLIAATMPVPKKRSDPVPAPSIAPPKNTEPAMPEPVIPEPVMPEPSKPAPVTIEAAVPSAPDTIVAGVETVPDSAAASAATTIAPGALIPIDLADTMPVSLKRKAPAYSAAAKQLRLSGTVVMNVLVSDRGTVDQVVLVSGVPGADLNDAAMAAARAWTYRPATKNGVPVKVWRSESVVFKP